jgi:nucleoside-diphosphate-sugar epimerase
MDLRGATIAVTGATGFLGRYVVAALLARGARVVGVVRNPARVPELGARGVDLRQADLAERERLARGFTGADAVVSNAALLSLRNRRWEDHNRANIQGTHNVLDAVADAGVKRIVHVSSVAVYRRHRPLVTEDAPQLGDGSWRTPVTTYAISKAVSEQRSWQLAAAHGLSLTCVRPCAMYGAFDPHFTAVFRRLVSQPVTLMPVGTRISLVYAGDVAEAIARALERPVSAGRAYNVTGDELSLWDFWRAWRAAGGPGARRAVPFPLPFRRRYDNTRAERDLGFANRPFADAVQETFALEATSAGDRSGRPPR